MQPAATDLLQIAEALEPPADVRDVLGVALVVDRVGHRHARDPAAAHPRGGRQADLLEFSDRERDELIV
ncbi:unannotated protein [freshwater metagenome]|uniref:Unannotated protein n=1 Tax=freshwater metagenome TaxID=449393 RepID=A0A6J7EGU4_9ZZZZ